LHNFYRERRKKIGTPAENLSGKAKVLSDFTLRSESKLQFAFPPRFAGGNTLKRGL